LSCSIGRLGRRWQRRQAGGAQDSTSSKAKRRRRSILPPAASGAREAGLGPAKAAPPRRAIALDFDGTVTEDDLLDEIASRFGDAAVYQEVEDGLHSGRLPLCDVISREFRPVTAPVDEVVAWTLGNVRIRPGFRELLELARVRGWRVLVVSSGFHELIEPILEREGVHVDVHANRLDARPDGWVVQWRYEDCDACGESCKRSVVAGFAGGDEVVYIGDGYSDRCAAEAADRVFATKGLARYLDEREVPYERFDDFHDVARSLAS
jgi:2-hydroxy-3-keto-5-methylthiopentenyl-1-phosphate phosphatase